MEERFEFKNKKEETNIGSDVKEPYSLSGTICCVLNLFSIKNSGDKNQC